MAASAPWSSWWPAALVAALCWIFAVALRSLSQSLAGKPPPRALPAVQGQRALFRRLREDAHLLLAASADASLPRGAALFSPAAAAARPCAAGPGAATLAVDGLAATFDPRVARALLQPRAHSLGRSAVYRLVAWVMPLSDGMLFASGAAWRRRHSLLTPLFSSSHVARLAAEVFVAGVRAAEVACAAAGAGAVAGGGGGGGGGGSGGGSGGGNPF